jgi:UDP-N-acetylmuramoylalanine--D-glutamate ligase
MMDETQTESAALTVILGMGATGWSCARFLHRRGVRIAVTDTRDAPPYGEHLIAQMPEVARAFGGIDAGLVACASTLVISPGVPRDEPAIAAATARGVPVIGDIELFARNVRAPVIAITGSNGKSTVTSMLADMAAASGVRAGVGGNLGTPVLDLLGEPQPDLYILELSSFQLESCFSLRPLVSVLLNISADHMDRYAQLADYVAAKARVHAGSRHQVVNADDPQAATTLPDDASPTWFTLAVPRSDEYGLLSGDGRTFLALGKEPLLAADELSIRGRHNLANALAALAAGRTAGFPLPAMIEALRKFKGLPHRCELVARDAGADWINDSKGTNVGATCAAIDGLSDYTALILIAGGDGKGADFRPLADAAAGRVRTALLYGKDAPGLERALEDVTETKRVADLDQAVQIAAACVRRGEAVLLSPACASLDMFANYEARGDAFARAVHQVMRS